MAASASRGRSGVRVVSAGRLVLGIDTAQRFGSIALAGNGNAAAWESLAPGEHSSGLSRAAERILSGRGLELQDLAGIAVSGGPGSFTGLRIGLAWAKGVCLGLSLELTLVSEHEVNAYRHRQSPGLIATVLLVATLREAAGASKVTVAAPELPSPLLESLRGAGFLTASADSLPPTAAAVAELGDRNLLAGRAEDLAAAAPSYGRAPNARKPTPSP
ncbi:MAG: tRNA (adenosine(37)-N6)-threonylcarbamoyltransferase complex dimerization subunit type 1 TsaB [Candidatus Eisenbacteria bacterium]|uniref:tRNA (Adenosine(37)-N6)-threonylcarbamoyltransferase complex dimerization subunit type 1 TsaB n=1 Tax=Eiseniibacteriota bacterium TaxID=2212470 RepID=A0A538T7H9_UNCEI|nr:MAG: tRNA (adenosine(37)-N6)-threonylcarbamoyltransferase complex dimerization subunit type 1 TsaB [Candidatus Eisenbacteria bacterium]